MHDREPQPAQPQAQGQEQGQMQKEQRSMCHAVSCRRWRSARWAREDDPSAALAHHDGRYVGGPGRIRSGLRGGLDEPLARALQHRLFKQERGRGGRHRLSARLWKHRTMYWRFSGASINRLLYYVGSSLSSAPWDQHRSIGASGRQESVLETSVLRLCFSFFFAFCFCFVVLKI